MPIYRAADIVFKTTAKSDEYASRLKKYQVSDDVQPDIKINIPDEAIENCCVKGKCSSFVSEYMLSGQVFYQSLLRYNGFMIHSSAILYKGNSYIFSADSGTGKSTHTSIWQRVFGQDNVQILNDDKPAIRIFDDDIFAYGTPWSGKDDISLNAKAPLKGIVFLERDDTNHIERITPAQAFPKFFAQTVRKMSMEYIDRLLPLADELLRRVPVYLMGCNMEDEAAIVAEKMLTSQE
ncbi:MAG: hypothetical protein ACI4II_04240 [Acutalibacteraceae bacterium]